MGYVDPGLQSLFMLLRQAGIPVGLEEIRRLGTVFAAAPALDEEGLRQVIEAVCIKSVEQQKTFRRVYERWLAAAEKQLADAEKRFKTQHDWSQKHYKSAKLSAQMAVPALPPATAPQPAVAPGAAPSPTAQAPAQAAARSVPDLQEVKGGLLIPVAPQSSGEADTALPTRPEDEQARDVISPGPAPLVPWRVPRMVWLAAVLVVLVAITWQSIRVGPDQPPPDAGPGPSSTPFVKPPESGKLYVYRPEIAAQQRPEPPLDLAGYGAVAGALILGAWLFLRRGRGRWLPSVPRAQAVPGAVALARGAVNSPGGALFLDAQDEETLVWGVGRFVSDEPSHTLDIDRTVHETAAAYGRAVLRYESARYNREVWLWLDESMDSPVARHLARDLASTLRSSGLPVTVATFWGIPTQLRNGENVVTLDEMESQREGAAVAVLTDGRLMHTAHRALDRSPALHELLRNLSFWPRVTFIDFGRGRLAPIVEPHGLRVIAPQDAPAALSDLAEGSERPAHRRLVGDARVWAAACALSSRPVDDPTALKLRQMLGLGVSPWAIETLREHADHRAGGMSWSTRGRADLMGWLLDAEELPEKGLPPPESLLARIVAAWDRLLVERERAQRTSDPGWEGSPAQEALRVERAFVHVWDRPDEAATTLYELFHGPLQPAIRHGLGELAPRECADHADSIPLPWALRHQRRETQVMLTEMGLGAQAGLDGRRSLPRPGRLLLALGLCAGVAAGGAWALVAQHLAREAPAPSVIDAWPDGGKPVFLEIDQQPTQSWQVRASTPWFPEPVTRALAPGQDYRLYAERQELACEQAEQAGRLLRCCNSKDTVATPPPRFRDRWSFVVLALSQYWPDATTEELANRLLCSGTADGVFLSSSSEGMPDWSAWAGAEPEQSQLLVVSDRVPAALDRYRGRAVVISTEQSRALLDLVDFEGDRSLAERKPALVPLSGDAATFLVRGAGACGAEGQPCCWPDARLDHCELGLTCENGTCVAQSGPEPVCEPGTVRCEGPHTLARCNAAGTDKTLERCAADQECRNDRCVPLARPCTPGGPSCSADGTVVLTCEDESRRLVRKPCPAGSLCSEGACYDIQAASVTFEVHMRPKASPPPPRSLLRCSVNGESLRWPLDGLPGLQLVSRTMTVAFQPRRPHARLEIACWQRASSRDEWDDSFDRMPSVETREHAWTHDSARPHLFQIAGVPGLRVVYTIRIHLTAPGSEAAPASGQARDRDEARKSTGAGASPQRPQQRREDRQRNGVRDD